MKKWLVIACLPALAACGSIQNPINNNDLAAVVSAYGAALSIANGYKSLPLCKTGTTASITNVCARRSVIVTLQQADLKAQVALKAAINFTNANPQLSATSFISAAQTAVGVFQQLETANGVQ